MRRLIYLVIALLLIIGLVSTGCLPPNGLEPNGRPPESRLGCRVATREYAGHMKVAEIPPVPVTCSFPIIDDNQLVVIPANGKLFSVNEPCEDIGIAPLVSGQQSVKPVGDENGAREWITDEKIDDKTSRKTYRVVGSDEQAIKEYIFDIDDGVGFLVKIAETVDLQGNIVEHYARYAGQIEIQVNFGLAIDDSDDDSTTYWVTDFWFEYIIRMPQRESPNPDDVDISDAWDRFWAGLWDHEWGHRAIAERNERLIEAEATAAATRPTVTVPKNTSDAVVDQMILTLIKALTTFQTYETEQEQYDVNTQHGKTQGAVWPPEPIEEDDSDQLLHCVAGGV